jgi:hypothetical protein
MLSCIRVSGFGFRVSGLGVYGLGFRVFGVSGVALKVSEKRSVLEFRV